jgi:hypothetical protein
MAANHRMLTIARFAVNKAAPLHAGASCHPVEPARSLTTIFGRCGSTLLDIVSFFDPLANDSQ